MGWEAALIGVSVMIAFGVLAWVLELLIDAMRRE